MSIFDRQGHYRTNSYGTTFWVRSHLVNRQEIKWTYESVTIPNAICPVCGEQVFYYENRSGARVFFDELGPDWPKHPCTDNNKRKYEPRALINGSRKPYVWEANGWQPIFDLEIEGRGPGWLMLQASDQNGKKQLFWVKDNIDLESISSPIFYRQENGETTFQWWEAGNNIFRIKGQVKQATNWLWKEVLIKNHQFTRKTKRMIWEFEFLDREDDRTLVVSSEVKYRPNQPHKCHVLELDKNLAVVRYTFKSDRKNPTYFLSDILRI